MSDFANPKGNPPPGWYPHPGGGPGRLYWDGRQWSTTSILLNDRSPQLRGGTAAPVQPRQFPWLIASLAIAALVVPAAVFIGVIDKESKAMEAASSRSSESAAQAAAQAAATPEQTFKRDMQSAFEEIMNGDKGLSELTTFRDSIADTGHEICGYLGSHSYDETAKKFRGRIAFLHPTDSDARTMVDLAIQDLCPEYRTRIPG